MANRLACANEVTGLTALACGTGAPGWYQIYTYDKAGNRAVTSSSPQEQLSVPTNINQYSSSTNRISLQSNGQPMPADACDAAGNLHNHPWMGTFTYDAENRMTDSTLNGTSTSYAYDGEGRRVSKTTTAGTAYYVYAAMGELAAEYAPVAATAGRKYLTVDALGSTRLVTSADGTAAQFEDYLPFGEQVAAGTNGRSAAQFSAADVLPEKKFAGKERDAETGLDYFGARYMSAAQGRFTTADPLMASARISNPQTWNRYSYTLNNPLRFIDPDGLKEISVADCQKDSECTVVSVNVILDKGLSKEQRNNFNKVLQGAKDDLGNSNVALDVSTVSGAVKKTGVTGVDASKANIFVSALVPSAVTHDISLSGSLRGATKTDPSAQVPVMFISGQNATGFVGPSLPFLFSGNNTITHEMLHGFSGDATRDAGFFEAGWHEYQIDRQATGLHFNIAPLTPDQTNRAKTYSVPPDPRANKPTVR